MGTILYIIQDFEVSKGCRQGVGRVSAGCRKLLKSATYVYTMWQKCVNCHNLAIKVRHLRYPCDTLARGGVSQNKLCIPTLIEQNSHLRYLFNLKKISAVKKIKLLFRCRKDKK